METVLERTITINGNSFAVSFSNKTKHYYKKEFRKNPIKVLDKVNVSTPEGLLKALKVTYPQLMWALAKTSNPDLPKYKVWQESLGDYNMLDYLDDLEKCFPAIGGESNG